MEQKNLARLTGFLYLFIVAGGIFAEAFVRGQLVNYSDGAATATNILNSELLFRVGIFTELMIFVVDAAVTALLYILLAPVNRTMAIVSTSFRGVTVAMLGINLVHNFIPLILLKGQNFQGLGADQIQSLSLLFMKAHGTGYGLALVFFSVHCVLLGYLLYKSHYLPRIFGSMLILAGVCYFVNSFASIVFPALGNVLFPIILLPPFIAELSFSVWLIVKGLKR